MRWSIGKYIIDISIWSPNGEYVIIIENKLFAKDRHSQHITQLGRYGEAILKDKELNINSSEHIFYVYLTLRGLEPTACPGQSEHKLSHLALMSYEKILRTGYWSVCGTRRMLLKRNHATVLGSFEYTCE